MTTSTPVLKVRSPGQIAALVPHLTGFAPTESIVAISLRGRRRRIGLTLRADLTDHGALADQVVSGMARDGAASCALVVFTDAPSSGRDHPWAPLVDAVEEGLARRGIGREEVLLVRAGRWWSYRCRLPCCPVEGLPVEDDSEVVRATAAEHAYEGRAVLASRAEMVAGLQPQVPFGAAAPRRAQEEAAQALAARVRRDPRTARRDEVARWASALDAWEQRPGGLDAAVTAELAVGLHLVAVRDTVASWGVDRYDVLRGLLTQLCQGVVAPDDAPLCSVLAWVAYAHGDGGFALTALQRALATDPGYSAATLLLEAYDRLLPPDQVLEVLRLGPAPE